MRLLIFRTRGMTTGAVVIIPDIRRDRLVSRRERLACVHACVPRGKECHSSFFSQLRRLVVLAVHVACIGRCNIVRLRTRRGTARSRRGLPVACYESCQSPECNRYRGPEVGIRPIRSAPPRACRRPGRFIMLISLRQGSRTPRALSVRLASHRLPARSCLPRPIRARGRTRGGRRGSCSNGVIPRGEEIGLVR